MRFHFPVRLRWACVVFLGSITSSLGTELVAAEQAVQPRAVDALIGAVLARNPDLASQQFRASSRQELVASAGALDDPRVNYAIAPGSIGDSIPSKFGDALRVRQNIQLSQTIPWPGKLDLRTERMAADAEAARHNVVVTRVELVAEARSVWAQWWYIHAALEINQELQQLVAEQIEVTETRYANGIGLQQDLVNIQSFDVRLQHQHLVLEQQQRRLQTHLNYLLDQPAPTPLLPPAPELNMPTIPPKALLEDWLLQTQPELLELQAQSQVARLNQRLTEKEDYPDMQFSVGYNELWNEAPLRLQVGVSVNIPLDFGKRAARKSAAELEFHSAQMAIASKRSELLAALESQISIYDQAVHGVQLIETQLLPSSRQLVNASLANYEGGGGRYTDVVDAQEQLLDTRLLLLTNYADQFTALAEIDKLTGGQLWPSGEQQ